ncbi:expressed unknown protein [Seminavis robusta]|uniref:Uncharacterized protein n=1 Tax=Seminavis robusta TaxID=568900 RepID=A0A9N8HQ61_9STRA|nr:expressed unknown protein [Seminavis robusta]|eukprot:Sro955_g224430.1 n/a (1445) ;mRNA; f:12009-16343
MSSYLQRLGLNFGGLQPQQQPMVSETTTEASLSMTSQQQPKASVLEQLPFAGASDDGCDRSEGSFATATMASSSLDGTKSTAAPVFFEAAQFDEERELLKPVEESIFEPDGMKTTDEALGPVEVPKNDNLHHLTEVENNDLPEHPAESSTHHANDQQLWTEEILKTVPSVDPEQQHQDDAPKEPVADDREETTLSSNPNSVDTEKTCITQAPAVAPDNGEYKTRRTVSKNLGSADTQKTCVTFSLPADDNNNNNNNQKKNGKRGRKKGSKQKERSLLNSPPLQRKKGWAPTSVSRLQKNLKSDLDECSVQSRKRTRRDSAAAQNDATVGKDENKKPSADKYLQRKPKSPTKSHVIEIGGQEYNLVQQEQENARRQSKRKRSPSLARLMAMGEEHNYPKRQRSPATYAGLDDSDDDDDVEEHVEKKPKRRRNSRKDATTPAQEVIEIVDNQNESQQEAEIEVLNGVKSERLEDVHELARQSVKIAFKRANTPDPGSPAFSVHKAHEGLRRPSLMEGSDEPQQPTQPGLFSQDADTNLRVLYHLTRASLVKGEIQEALLVCHDVLDSCYTQAEEILPKLKGEKTPAYSQKLKILRDKIAGAWCLYAHLFLQITETSVFLGATDQSKGVGKASLSREDFSRNEMEEQLWDYSIALLSFCTSCPLAGNHASITLALSRLRFRRREQNKLRTFPVDGVMKGTRSYLAKLVGSTDHWKKNLELAMGVCKGALERRSWCPGNATTKISRQGKYAGLTEPFDLISAAEGVAVLVSKLHERNIDWSTIDALEKVQSKPKVAPGFFTFLLTLPKRLQGRLKTEFPTKLDLQTSAVPYLYDDFASAQLICKETNCLSRLVQSVRGFTETSQLQMICDPEKLEYDAACVDGVAWEDCLFFQSMNVVLVEAAEADKYKYAQKHPTDAATFFVPISSSSSWKKRFEVDGYAKYPSSLVYSHVELRCLKCDGLFPTKAKLQSHKRGCRGDGSRRGGHSLQLTWDDLSAVRPSQGYKADATKSKSKTTKTKVIDFQCGCSKCCSKIYQDLTVFGTVTCYNTRQQSEAADVDEIEPKKTEKTVVNVFIPPKPLPTQEASIGVAEKRTEKEAVKLNEEPAPKPKGRRGRPPKKNKGPTPKKKGVPAPGRKRAKGKRPVRADLNCVFEEAAVDDDIETVVTALPVGWATNIKQAPRNGMTAVSVHDGTMPEANKISSLLPPLNEDKREGEQTKATLTPCECKHEGEEPKANASTDGEGTNASLQTAVSPRGIPPMLDESHDEHDHSVEARSPLPSIYDAVEDDAEEAANKEQKTIPKRSLLDFEYACRKCYATGFSAEMERDLHERECLGQSVGSSLAEPWPSFANNPGYTSSAGTGVFRPVAEGPTSGSVCAQGRHERHGKLVNVKRRRIGRNAVENSGGDQRTTRSNGSPGDQLRRSRRNGGPADQNGIAMSKKKTTLVGS